MDNLDNYERIKTLGSGAYATVHLVNYKPTNTQYAMKEILIGQMDSETKKYMLREA